MISNGSSINIGDDLGSIKTSLHKKKRMSPYLKPLINVPARKPNFDLPKNIQGRVLSFEQAVEPEYLDGITTDKDLKTLAMAIKSTRKLEKLEIICPDCLEITDLGFDYIVESLRKLESLKSLHLNFKESKISDKSIYQLSKALKTLKGLANVCIVFKKWSDLTDTGVRKLRRAFKVLLSLRNLRLSFNWLDEISNESLDLFSNLLAGLTHVRSLELDTGPYCQMAKIERFCQTLIGLKSLNRLSLKMKECPEIDQDSIETLSSTLKTLTSLEKLDLNFAKGDNVTDQVIFSLAEALQDLILLRRLRLNFTECENITSTGVVKVWEALKACKSLESLDNRFFWPGEEKVLLKEEFSKLGEYLKTLGPFKELSLHLKTNNKMTEWYRYLVAALAGCSSLESLKIKTFLTRNEMSGKHEFSEGLRKLTNLKSLDLKFTMSPWIPLQNLFGALESLKSLENLCLKCKNYEITNKDFDYFGQILNKLGSLKTLSFYFKPHSEKASHEGLNLFAQNLAKVPFLEKIDLVIFETGEAVNGLYEGLGEMKYLRDIRIILDQLSEVNQEGISVLSEALRHLPQLQKVSIEFRDCSIEWEDVEEISRTFEALPHLKNSLLRIN